MLFVSQRLTKYPLLIQPLSKSALTLDDKVEHEKLIQAESLVKEILCEVDSRVAEKDMEERKWEIYRRIDTKSHAILKQVDERSDAKEMRIKEVKFRRTEIVSSVGRKLK